MTDWGSNGCFMNVKTNSFEYMARCVPPIEGYNDRLRFQWMFHECKNQQFWIHGKMFTEEFKFHKKFTKYKITNSWRICHTISPLHDQQLYYSAHYWYRHWVLSNIAAAGDFVTLIWVCSYTYCLSRHKRYM